MTDAYLIGSIVNGDAEAVRPLMERYRRPLGAMLQRALGSSPEVEDVFQETWIRVVRSAHRYDPEQRFSAWLFSIAWNLVKDRWSRRVPAEDVDLTAMASPERSPEERAVEADRAERVRGAVSRLPERLAQAILLRYFEELSEKEVAERLGIPVGTVKSRIHHGLRLLRDFWSAATPVAALDCHAASGAVAAGAATKESGSSRCRTPYRIEGDDDELQ